MNAFAGGLPMKKNGDYDLPEIINRTAKFGGLPALQGLMPYLSMPGAGDDALVGENASRAAQGLPLLAAGGNRGAPQPTAAGTAPTNDPQNAGYFEHFVNGVAQAETGAERNPYGSVISTGTGHKVYGKYQIYDDNIPQWTQEAGLGRMTPQQFLADPKAQEAVARYKLGDYVQKYGYAGAARAWLAGEGGMNNPQARDKFGSTPSGYAAKVLGYASRSAAGGTTAAASPGQTPPTAVGANASDQAGSPAAMGKSAPTPERISASTGGGRPESAQPTAGPENAAQGQVAGGGGANAPTPGPIIPRQQPSSTGPIAEPGGPVPQTVGRGGAAIPAPGVVPTQPQPQQRQPLPPPADPTLGDPYLANLNTALKGAEDAAKRWGRVPNEAGRTQSANFQKTADDLRRRITDYEKFKRGQVEQSPAEREAARAGMTPSEYQLKNEAEKQTQTAVIKDSAEKWTGIRGKAAGYEEEQRDYVDLAQGILNDPRVYTGIGATASLDTNKIKNIYGDTTPALLQTALQKVTSRDILAQIAQMRSSLKEAGADTGRLFAAQIDKMMQASASLENTVAANRLLVESERRAGELAIEMRRQAIEYRNTHNKVLDDGFDEQIHDYLTRHPLFSKEELKDPAKLGAPTLPAAIAGDHAKELAWAIQMGLTRNDPVRTPDGKSYLRLRELRQ